MKISIKRKVPTSISLNPKHKPKYKTVEEQVELKDELLVKYIALIDELTDRTWDELENRSWGTAVVPLVPFPFFEKYREPENSDGGYWVAFWLDTTIRNNIFERSEIVHTLYELGGITGIEKDPIVDLKTGQLSGTAFTITIDRNELRALRKTLAAEYKKQSKNNRSRTIDVNEMGFSEALYLLRTLYSKVIEILDTVCRGPIMMGDTRLNFFYTILLQAVDNILELKGFEELQKEMPDLFDSLVGDLSDADIEWEHGGGPAARNFFAKIEKRYITNGAEIFELPKNAHHNLSEADEALREYRKQVGTHWGRTLKAIDEEKKEGKFGFGESVNEPDMAIPDNFVVSIKDREIWVNDFILSKPFATHPNKEFFDYVYANAGVSLPRAEIPEYAKRALQGGKSFVSVLNNLGFKSQILRAFFPERGKTSILLKKSVSTADLKERGVKIGLFLQELRTAHAKNSPE